MKKILSILLSITILLTIALSPITSYALNLTEDDLDNLDVYGICDYEKSFECLEYINKYRADYGAEPLTMDKTQLEIAMCRAAECAVFFSHGRPVSGYFEDKNKIEYTLFDGIRYEKVYMTTVTGENLTGCGMDGKDSALSWFNSIGHRATMISSNWKSTGIGCFRYLDFYVWIEVFGFEPATEKVEANNYPQSLQRTISVLSLPDRYDLCIDIIDTEYEEEQYTGQSGWIQNEQDRIVLRIIEGDETAHYHTTIIDHSKVTYSSLNPDKVAVDEDGTFTVLVNENTTATLCAEYQGKKYYKDIQIVKQDDKEPDVPWDPDIPWNPDCDCEYDDGVITEPADCLYYGTKKYTCKKCGNSYEEWYADQTAHNYKTTVTKATTKKNGSVITKCTLCDNIKSKSTIYYPKTISLSKTSYTYDGKTKKPSVTVKDSKGKAISSKYYTVSYDKGRKNVGKYTVTIKFKGNYSGTVKKTFTIKPKATTISKLSKGRKAFTMKWNKQKSQTTGYQIQYSTSSKFKNAKAVTISKNKTVSKKITKLKGKKKYYVRVRTYKTVKVNGKNVKIYSSWSKAKSVKTK